MSLNPTAVVWWGFCSLIGFFIAGTGMGALIGLTVGLGITLLAEIFT